MATSKQLYSYILFLLLAGWTVQILAVQITGDPYSEDAQIWLAGTMLTPLVVTLFFLKANKNLRGQFLWKPNSKIFLISFVALLIPILIGFIILLTLQLLDLGKSEWFVFSNSEVTIQGGPFFLGKGPQSWLVFVTNILLTGAAFSLLNAVIATCEEFAWRGLLQPLITDKFGWVKGLTLLGFIWSIWHLPILLNGYNYPETPLLGSFILFPIRLIATSYYYAWLTVKSNSFLPASIAHGAGNGIQEAIVANMNMEVSQIYENAITILVTLIVGLIFLAFIYKKERPTT